MFSGVATHGVTLCTSPFSGNWGVNFIFSFQRSGTTPLKIEVTFLPFELEVSFGTFRLIFPFIYQSNTRRMECSHQTSKEQEIIFHNMSPSFTVSRSKHNIPHARIARHYSRVEEDGVTVLYCMSLHPIFDNDGREEVNVKEVLLSGALFHYEHLCMKDCIGTQFPYLSSFTRLTGLKLDGCDMNGCDLNFISNLTSLRYLIMVECTGIYIPPLHNLHNLEMLEYFPDGEGELYIDLENISNTTSLKELSIGHCDGGSIKLISGLTKLTSLTLNMYWGKADFESLADLTNLKVITLVRFDFSEKPGSLEHLTSLTSLKELRLNNCNVI